LPETVSIALELEDLKCEICAGHEWASLYDESLYSLGHVLSRKADDLDPVRVDVEVKSLNRELDVSNHVYRLFAVLNTSCPSCRNHPPRLQQIANFPLEAIPDLASCPGCHREAELTIHNVTLDQIDEFTDRVVVAGVVSCPSCRKANFPLRRRIIVAIRELLKIFNLNHSPITNRAALAAAHETVNIPRPIRLFYSYVPGDYASLPGLVDRNAPELEPVLQSARQALGCTFAEVLKRNYATGVRDLAAAIYEAVRCTVPLQYDYEPANPGEVYQEVRLAREVLESKIGTCLDLALLYAALLERAHLAPAIFFVDRNGEWHAIGGFFDNRLESSTMQVVSDIQLIAKMVNTGSLILVETTGLCPMKGKKKTYIEAVEQGALIFTNARALAVVDVLAARNNGLKPPE